MGVICRVIMHFIVPEEYLRETRRTIVGRTMVTKNKAESSRWRVSHVISFRRAARYELITSVLSCPFLFLVLLHPLKPGLEAVYISLLLVIRCGAIVRQAY